MGQGDYMPIGGHRRRSDPKHAAQIIKGAEEGNKIHQKANEYHDKVDVPAAEEVLKELDDL